MQSHLIKKPIEMNLLCGVDSQHDDNQLKLCLPLTVSSRRNVKGALIVIHGNRVW